MPRNQTAHVRHLARSAAGAVVVLTALCAASAGAAEERHGPAPPAPVSCVEDDCNERCEERLAVARRFSARYLREAVALRDGYVADRFCVAAPGLGAMGIHYANFALMADIEVDARYPEVLLYAERPDGKRYLVAVEYLAPVLSNGRPWLGGADDPPPVIDNPAPVLFGKTFDGPMPGHAPGMPWHYDLHVWIWKHNPAGTFAQFNPELACG